MDVHAENHLARKPMYKDLEEKLERYSEQRIELLSLLTEMVKDLDEDELNGLSILLSRMIAQSDVLINRIKNE